MLKCIGKRHFAAFLFCVGVVMDVIGERLFQRIDGKMTMIRKQLKDGRQILKGRTFQSCRKTGNRGKTGRRI